MGLISWLIKDDLSKALGEANGALHELRLENAYLRARIQELEQDERKTREGLLTRMGILPGEKKEGPQPALRPVNKTRMPWAAQASKLEIDSRERYYKEKIAAIEKKDQESESSEEEKQDIEELSK